MPELVRNKKFVLTGTMTKQRSSVIRDISVAGGFVESTITYSIDYLVTPNYGYRRTTKIQKAEQYGIPIITESQLYERLRGATVQQARESAEQSITQSGGLDLSSFFEE